jgi:hypothetical protein
MRWASGPAIIRPVSLEKKGRLLLRLLRGAGRRGPPCQTRVICIGSADQQARDQVERWTHLSRAAGHRRNAATRRIDILLFLHRTNTADQADGHLMADDDAMAQRSAPLMTMAPCSDHTTCHLHPPTAKLISRQVQLQLRLGWRGPGLRWPLGWALGEAHMATKQVPGACQPAQPAAGQAWILVLFRPPAASSQGARHRHHRLGALLRRASLRLAGQKLVVPRCWWSVCLPVNPTPARYKGFLAPFGILPSCHPAIASRTEQGRGPHLVELRDFPPASSIERPLLPCTPPLR